MNLNEKYIKRFWERTKKESIDSCWEWISYKGSGNYGLLYINGKSEKAHRVSWTIHNGEIPETDDKGERICICHKCDNPSCVNPKHLFVGTHTDNMKDRDQKGRLNPFRPIGSLNGNAVTSKDVRIIEKKLSEGCKNVDLAKEFDISEALVSNIRNKQHWSQRAGST